MSAPPAPGDAPSLEAVLIGAQELITLAPTSTAARTVWSSAIAVDPAGQPVGTSTDNLPFWPTGEGLASIAWRTWIYSDTGPERTRYGYLRAGALVERRGPAITNQFCEEGWYRINPRGFVCVGKGATLSTEHPVVRASRHRPRRNAGLPYVYTLSAQQPPYLYTRLPQTTEMLELEGEFALKHARSWRERARQESPWSDFRAPTAPSTWLAQAAVLPKPYGVQQGLHYSAHAGRAAPDAGFALLEVIDWQQRWFGLTTELDLIALDATRVVRASEFQGLSLAAAQHFPLGIVPRAKSRYARDPSGEFVLDGATVERGLLLLEESVLQGGIRFWRGQPGYWLPEESLRVVHAPESLPEFAVEDRKWIDVSIARQLLIAYEGRQPKFVTLVSTGAGGLGDPAQGTATVRGTFVIHAKHVSATMDGADDKQDSFSLRDVPFVQYFHEGYALHGTYWHDAFGQPKSHGCINLSPRDAAFLFEWTDPVVPKDWHGAVTDTGGTLVHIHP